MTKIFDLPCDFSNISLIMNHDMMMKKMPGEIDIFGIKSKANFDFRRTLFICVLLKMIIYVISYINLRINSVLMSNIKAYGNIDMKDTDSFSLVCCC